MRYIEKDGYTYLSDSAFWDEFKPHQANQGESLKEYDFDAAEVAEAPENKVWTLLDCDGVLIIGPGWHFVNRMAYILTDVPWDKNTPDVLWLDADIEEGLEEEEN